MRPRGREAGQEQAGGEEQGAGGGAQEVSVPQEVAGPPCLPVHLCAGSPAAGGARGGTSGQRGPCTGSAAQASSLHVELDILPIIYYH